MPIELKAMAFAIRANLDNSDDSSEPAVSADDVAGLRLLLEEHYPGLRGYIDALLGVEKACGLLSLAERSRDVLSNVTEALQEAIDDAARTLEAQPRPDSRRILGFYAFLCGEESRLRDEEAPHGG